MHDSQANSVTESCWMGQKPKVFLGDCDCWDISTPFFSLLKRVKEYSCSQKKTSLLCHGLLCLYLFDLVWLNLGGISNPCEGGINKCQINEKLYNTKCERP